MFPKQLDEPRQKLIERSAVRGILLTPEKEILLICAKEPKSNRALWVAPGGGLEKGELPEKGLRREVEEETGLRGFSIGPLVWWRQHTFDWDGYRIAQHERYYLIETARFDPTAEANPDDMERDAFQEFRWWTAEQMTESTELFVPGNLGGYIEQLGAGEAVPFDAGV